eukprot:TRINITY_DN10407_c0_g1_i1.p1 TRINITY_DN10407_c0_g1~~TRINITY_DN10407_c0_g1_i1.p1  ORF type:complete len:92 (+),score=7.12 TRINITY_DN10407_c0_g1_i1:180-455(+)
MNLLELVNEALGMSMFGRDDVLVFLARTNQLNTKTKLEQILHFENGWHIFRMQSTAMQTCQGYLSLSYMFRSVFMAECSRGNVKNGGGISF